eukprot:COSAG06_NODE_4029_length_4643_cov_7.802597_4_plen_136_part_00
MPSPSTDLPLFTMWYAPGPGIILCVTEGIRPAVCPLSQRSVHTGVECIQASLTGCSSFVSAVCASTSSMIEGVSMSAADRWSVESISSELGFSPWATCCRSASLFVDLDHLDGRAAVLPHLARCLGQSPRAAPRR